MRGSYTVDSTNFRCAWLRKESDVRFMVTSIPTLSRCGNTRSDPRLLARLHYGTNPRIPPLFCVADDGWTISTKEFVDNPKHHFSKGEHGYDNNDPNMRALFIAHGPAFKQGLIVPEFENVNVYPLLTHVLGIEPAVNDGDFNIVRDMLR